jgi:PAS domain S-box-containing protein
MPSGKKHISRCNTDLNRQIADRRSTEGDSKQANAEVIELQQILQQSRNKLKAIFDAMDDPVFSFTPNRRVESVNFAAARLTGHHPRELVGLTCEEFLNKSAETLPIKEACLSAFERMLDDAHPQRGLVEALGADGPLFYDVSHTPVINENGEVSLAIVQVKDVTAFKRMELTIREYSQSLEQKVAERTAELTKANQELKRLDQLRQDLTNMVVHDMKGPLAGLMGNLDLMGFGELDSDQREALEMASMAGNDLLRMIMNLLDISRLEENRLSLNYEEIDLPKLAGRLQERFHTMVSLRGLELKTSMPADLDIQADQDLLYRVLQNLFTNALNHTEEGGIEIGAKAEADQQGRGGVLLYVADSGSGIPLAMRPHIFEKFSQAAPGSGPRPPRTSTGLGLTFCKLTVEAHGGRIWFDSTEGKGTTFYVWLPEKGGE